MPIAIREITADQWEHFREVRLRALADAPEAFGSTYASESDQPEAFWRSRLERPVGAALAADDEGTWIGIAGVFPDDDDARAAHLVSMWVDPAARRRGAGRLLVDAAVEWARAHAFDRLTLWVTETNDAAIRLYVSCGFEHAPGRQPLPSNPRLSELEMRRPL